MAPAPHADGDPFRGLARSRRRGPLPKAWDAVLLTADKSIPWFVAFLAWALLSGLLEPVASQNPAAIAEPARAIGVRSRSAAKSR